MAQSEISYFFGRARTIVFGTINFGKLAILIAIRLVARFN